MRLELDEAELLLTHALSSSRERVEASELGFGATLSYAAGSCMIKGELAAAETVFEEVRQTATELGVEPGIARCPAAPR